MKVLCAHDRYLLALTGSSQGVGGKGVQGMNERSTCASMFSWKGNFFMFGYFVVVGERMYKISTSLHKEKATAIGRKAWTHATHIIHTRTAESTERQTERTQTYGGIHEAATSKQTHGTNMTTHTQRNCQKDMAIHIPRTERERYTYITTNKKKTTCTFTRPIHIERGLQDNLDAYKKTNTYTER